MKEIMSEYGGMVLGICTAALFFGSVDQVIFARSGLFLTMIEVWMYGGC